MAQNRKSPHSRLLLAADGLKIIGSRNTAAEAFGLEKKKHCLDGITFISWKKCSWTCGELEAFGDMDLTDCFCMAVRKAGEMDAWIIAESFKDLWDEFPEIFSKVCKDKPWGALRSHITVFKYNKKSGLFPSDILTRRIADNITKTKKGINRKDLTVVRKVELDDGRMVEHLFVKGDPDIERKRNKEESQRALKQKFLSSISGNIDIELLNYANNKVNEKIKSIKDSNSDNSNNANNNSNDNIDNNDNKKLIDSLDLSFISIGTNWETRDGADEDGENEAPGKGEQLAFMKTIIDAIVNRCNVEIDYRPHGYAPMMCKVSPHRLRKDRQWIIYGHSTAVVEGVEQGGVFSFKLERIYGVKKIPGEYLGDDDENIKMIYKRISCNQVTYDVLTGNPTLQTVVIAVKGKVNSENTPGRVFAYNKIKEEKLHSTQTEISRDDVVRMGHKDAIKGIENWGFFKFEICDYDRIAYRLLQYQANLKVIAPYSLKNRMRKISESLYDLYH